MSNKFRKKLQMNPEEILKIFGALLKICPGALQNFIQHWWSEHIVQTSQNYVAMLRVMFSSIRNYPNSVGFSDEHKGNSQKHVDRLPIHFTRRLEDSRNKNSTYRSQSVHTCEHYINCYITDYEFTHARVEIHCYMKTIQF